MKIAISVTGNDLSAEIDRRFGRARGFLLVDDSTEGFEHVANPNIDAAGGAGIQTAQMVVERGAETVITGNVGPNAYRVLETAGVKVFTGASGNAEEALEDYRSGKLVAAASATVEEKSGMGAASTVGPGMGSGGGRGRGGGGRGRGGGRC
ncbi:NifB/NifX family molybdenum-iron cluster-binding protein [Patescibacteria group bacterium]|nr:NifB/NifX family molybdenum-iron cluster-binding protein [Patescibacteria group bacterium]